MGIVLGEFWRSWRFVFATVGAALLLSAVMLRIVSPLGDAALAALDSREKVVVGLLVAEKTPEAACVADRNGEQPVKYVLDDGRNRYVLQASSDSRRFLDRKVRVAGTFHQTTGILNVKSMGLVD